MEYKEMCKIVYPYTCPACGNDMLFFTRKRNSGIIDYKHIMEEMPDRDKLVEYLADKDIEFLKCVMCKKMYIMDWTSGYAKPLRDKNILKRFGYKFKE